MKKYLAILLALVIVAPALGIERNVASQKVYVTAIDSATGRPKTGDSLNLTLYVAKDGGTLTALGDTSATEYSSTNAPGVYWFDITQSETSATCLLLTGKSSTSGVDIIPQTLYTTPANFSLAGIDSSGRIDVGKWLGTAVATPRVAGFPEVSPPSVTWYVAASGGSDSNSGLTRSAPFATVAAAYSAAVSGDTIWLLAGSYSDDGTNPFVTISKNNITIRGDSQAGTVITCTALDGGIWLTGVGNKVSDLKINATNAGSYGVYCSGKWSTIERCDLTAVEVAAVLNADLCHVRHCNLSGGRYGIKTGGHNWLLENTLCAVTSTFTLSANSNFAAIYTTSEGTIRNCTASGVSVSATSTGKLIGLSSNASPVYCENLTISLLNVSATQTGGVYGIVDLNGGASVVALKGGSITATNSGGTGAAYEIDASVSGSNISGVDTVKTSSANWNPTGISNIHGPLQASGGASRPLDVTSTGEAGIDLANVGSPTTTLNLSGTTIKTATDVATATTAIKAKTDQLAFSTTDLGDLLNVNTLTIGGTGQNNGNYGDKLDTINNKIGTPADTLAADIAAGGGGTGGPILQRDPTQVLQVRDRGDGNFDVIGEIQAYAGEPAKIIALEYKGTVLRGAAKLYGMSAPTLLGDDSDKATVGTSAGVTYGECLTQARFTFQADETAETGADIKVKVRVTFSAGGDGFDVYVPANVKAAPE